MSAIDHEHTNEPVCPHCGSEQCDAWEWATSDDGETECGNCERSFSYSRFISISYSTRKEIECPECLGQWTPDSRGGAERKPCERCATTGKIPNDHA